MKQFETVKRTPYLFDALRSAAAAMDHLRSIPRGERTLSHNYEGDYNGDRNSLTFIAIGE